MSISSRHRNQQEAAEKRKALFEQLQATWRKKKSPSSSPQDAAPSAERPAHTAANGGAIPQVVQTPNAATVATVRMSDEPVLKLTVDGGKDREYLTSALRECVDLYLEAAQCGTRECVLLWPGTLECLPLIHALATIERWAQGYKLGLRAVLYPATSATYFPLNHVYANRGDISVLNAMWQEVTEPKQAVPKESCSAKDLMLFALASQFKDDEIQPCLNELLLYFLVETAETEIVQNFNYGSTYLSHVFSKLAKRGQKQ